MTLHGPSRKNITILVAGCVLACCVHSSSWGFVVGRHLQKNGLVEASSGSRHRVASVDVPGRQVAYDRKGTFNGMFPMSCVASSFTAVLFLRHRAQSRSQSRSRLRCSSARPVLLSSPDWRDGVNGIVGTLIRMGGAGLVFHHGMEHALEGDWQWPGTNVESVTAFAEFMLRPYFEWLPFFDMYTYALFRDYAETFGAVCLFIGLFTRGAGAVLTGTMFFAVYYHVAADGLRAYSFTEPMLFMMVYAFYAGNGGGHYSVDELICKIWPSQGEETPPP